MADQHLHDRAEAIEPKHIAQQFKEAIEMEPAVGKERPPMMREDGDSGQGNVGQDVLVETNAVALIEQEHNTPYQTQDHEGST